MALIVKSMPCSAVGRDLHRFAGSNSSPCVSGRPCGAPASSCLCWLWPGCLRCSPWPTSDPSSFKSSSPSSTHCRASSSWWCTVSCAERYGIIFYSPLHVQQSALFVLIPKEGEIAKRAINGGCPSSVFRSRMLSDVGSETAKIQSAVMQQGPSLTGMLR